MTQKHKASNGGKLVKSDVYFCGAATPTHICGQDKISNYTLLFVALSNHVCLGYSVKPAEMIFFIRPLRKLQEKIRGDNKKK